MIFHDAELLYRNNNVEGLEGLKGLSGMSTDNDSRYVKDSTVSN